MRSDVTKGDGIYSAMLLNLPMQSTSFSCVIEMIDSTGTVDQGAIFIDYCLIEYRY